MSSQIWAQILDDFDNFVGFGLIFQMILDDSVKKGEKKQKQPQPKAAHETARKCAWVSVVRKEIEVYINCTI